MKCNEETLIVWVGSSTLGRGGLSKERGLKVNIKR